MRSSIPVIYDASDEPKELPWKWAICGRCDGHGQSSEHLGCVTREDRDDDPEFFEAYMRGDFDRPCEHCEDGKVRVVDRDRCSADDLADYDQQVADDLADQRTQRMEMLMEGGWREMGYYS